MTWEGVPWMVDGGEHSAEVGRLLAYIASSHGEGIVAPSDCAVVASAIPDGSVHVLDGGVVALNRFPGGGTQSYVMRNVGDAVIALTPQGSGGERYDIVAVIVEDPEYPGQPDPVDEATGPYVRLKVYEDVDPATRFLYEIDPDQTGYALARVKFDASDGTITQSDITDLRRLVAPRTHTWKRMYNEVDEAAGGTGSYAIGLVEQTFPPNAEWVVEVPEWATKMQMSTTVFGVRVQDLSRTNPNAFSNGYLKVTLGDVATEWAQWSTSFNSETEAVYPSVTQMTMAVADEKDVPEEMRGTSQDAKIRGYKDPAAWGHNIGSEWGTVVIIEINFYEEPGF